MLFDEYLETMKVYRKIQPVSGWGDATWEYVDDIQGRFEPIDGSESFVQQQAFSDVTEIFLTDYANKSKIRSEDTLVDSDGILRRIVGELEDWKWSLINAHVAAKCRRAQWDV